MIDINESLERAARSFILKTAIVSVGETVQTTWAEWKRPQKVRITHVGAHLVCRYDDKLRNWVTGFAMEYNAERLRKDGSSKERNVGGAICLSNLQTEAGQAWEVGGRWREEFGFNHFGLSWGTSRDEHRAAIASHQSSGKGQ